VSKGLCFATRRQMTLVSTLRTMSLPISTNVASLYDRARSRRVFYSIAKHYHLHDPGVRLAKWTVSRYKGHRTSLSIFLDTIAHDVIANLKPPSNVTIAMALLMQQCQHVLELVTLSRLQFGSPGRSSRMNGYRVDIMVTLAAHIGAQKYDSG